MKTFSQFPLGLNSLLELRDRGLQLDQLADQVSATVDIRELLLMNAQRNLTIVNQNAVLGANTFTGAAVPPGELWYLWGYTVFAGVDAGESIRLVPTILANNGSRQAVGRPSSAAVLATAQFVHTYASIVPLWALPGSQFGFVAEELTGAAVACTMNLNYTPLRI